ncbi:MAG: Gfo/Idh/MocA family oxidoreductase [Nitrospirota bacterium]
MKKLRAGVIGAGYLGQFHAEKYAGLPNVELAGIVEKDPVRGEQIARKLNTEAFTDLSRFLDKVDVVSIVVPTILHHEIAKQVIEAGVHVLLEKPMTVTMEQADELIALASRKNIVLQVGHIERFNPAITVIQPLLRSPRYLQAERSAPFTVRCTDVNVVLDLMIHDLDIVSALSGSTPLKVSAAGSSIITREIDAVMARIVFANGCVADVTASRISDEKKRLLRIFDGDTLYTADYQTQKAFVSRRGPGDVPEFVTTEIATERRDTLREEITAFISCVEHTSRPTVSGIEGRNALALARLITHSIENSIAEFVPFT